MSSPTNDRANHSYIALGSNLEKPLDQLLLARRELEKLGRVSKLSSIYQSPPMEGGPIAQPDYLNAVVLLETNLSSRQLLSKLQTIEASHGRVQREKWAARQLDLDILSYEDEVFCEEHLTLPHPGILSRPFVLLPLQELDPKWTHPVERISIDEAIASLGDYDLEKVASFGEV